jgi:hypothetical protein
MIYTSYFGKYRGDKGVSIARWTPKWFVGETLLCFAPSTDLLNWWKKLTPELQHKLDNQMTYVERYNRETLEPLVPYVHELAKQLDGKVLLCYEKPEDFCHRHIVANWFCKYGYLCDELEY